MYRAKIECSNCFSRNNYDIEHGMVMKDAPLVCPNCGCCPTSENYVVVTDNGGAQGTKAKE